MKLILITSLILFGGCSAKKGNEMYFEMDMDTLEINGWINIDGEQHDIKIIGI